MVTSFQERVYAACSRVPRGKVTTYGEIARSLQTKAYRAVGNALHCNPYAPRVPCHRVVSSDGALGGFAYGAEAKIRLLRCEGVDVANNAIVGFETKLYKLVKDSFFH